MKYIFNLFILVILTLSVSAKTNNNESKLIENWSKSIPNFDLKKQTLFIAVDIKNCISCVNASINKVLEQASENGNFNIVFVIVTDDIKESLNIQKKFKTKNIIEDYNNTVQKEFKPNSLPILVIFDADFCIDYQTYNINNNLNMIEKKINTVTKSIKSMKIAIESFTKLKEKDDLLLSNIMSANLNKKCNLEVFESSNSIYAKFDIKTGNYLDYYILNDSVYMDFKKQTNYEDIWNRLKDQATLNQYYTKISNSDGNIYLSKVMGGIRKDTMLNSNKIDTVLVTDVKFCIVSIDSINNYKIIKSFSSNDDFYFEDIYYCLKNRENFIFAVVPKIVFFDDFVKKNDSINIIYQFDIKNNKFEPKLSLANLNFQNVKYIAPNYFLSNIIDEKLIYLDVANNLLSKININDFSVENLFFDSKIFSKNYFDVYWSNDDLYLFSFDSLLNIGIIDKFNLWQSQLLGSYTLEFPERKEIKAIKFVGIYDKKMFFLIKSKLFRWEIFSVSI